MADYPTERSLYHILIETFKELGEEITGVEEVKIHGRRYPDIKISYKGNPFYVQVKIGKLDKLTDILNDISKLIAHKKDYSQIKDVIGFIGIKFEEGIKNLPLIAGKEEQILREAIENKKVFVIISAFKDGSPFFHIIDGEITFSEAKRQIIEKLREFIEKKEIFVNPESIVRLLKEYINELAFILRTYYLSQSSKALVNLVGDISLFKSLLGAKEGDNIDLLEEEDYRAAIVDLLAFILVNQILFYYLYSKRSRGKLPELKQISSFFELKKYFDEILKIDFKAIYSINIFEKLPNDKELLNVVNNIINVLNANPVWKIPQDLLGRVYHEILPFRTRKVFATFYTHPIAAEILAGLTIDNYNETVIDPACGSGTLLVAAYNAKKELYRINSVEDEVRLHKKFVESDITGIDIMPFAAHIAAMNLSLQNIDVETNSLRIGVEDSLNVLSKFMSVNERDWTLVLETVSSELIKVIKGLKSKQKSLLSYLNNKEEKEVNIIIYTVDTADAELQISNKLREEGYKIFSINDESIDLSNSLIAILGIENENVNKLENVFRKLKEKGRFNLAIVIRKGRISNYVLDRLKEIFEGFPVKNIDTFSIRPFDVVIMNPPFSDYEKLPEEYKEKLRHLNNQFAFIRENVGGRANLWVYFLALAHFLLKDNGKIGAVIPINFARGAATEKIRDFFLDRYHIKWIIKPFTDLAFSEAAAFRDILLIASKRNPRDEDITGIVFIKKSIRSSEFTIEEARRIVKDLRSLYEKAREGVLYQYSDPNGFYDVYFIKYEVLRKYRNNLMPLLKEKGLEEDLMEEILEKATDKLVKIRENWTKFGFPTTPGGKSKIVFVTNPFDKNRIKRAYLLLDKKDPISIFVRSKDGSMNFRLSCDQVLPALRTLTDIKNIFLSEEKYDYIIIGPYRGSETLIKMFWKSKNKFDWSRIKESANNSLTYVALQRRIGLASENTHIIAICSDNRFVATDAFIIFNEIRNKYDAAILTIFLNSIIFLYEITKLIKETTGTYTEFMEKDLLQTYILNIDKLSDHEKQVLLDLFEEIKYVDFPSIIKQMKEGLDYIRKYRDKNWEEIFNYLRKVDPGMYARMRIDYTILKILGFNDDEIIDLLESLYDAVYNELKAINRSIEEN
ncbi:MAG: N-6 DNA methylase [Candidatus Nanoclepta minutus]|uniref:site-specific DNA-methyltransferase (adenine-specific) n=1 Tax=Candidatus Nanoclepta minutus TaxID=1940235 RepID=A0A397WR06_9ARCH|nr:MAG: N-6 DNA methylase [Candidatus Nanoclepta minutus]